MMIHFKHSACATALAAGIGIGLSSPSWAQVTNSGGSTDTTSLHEIVVTATRRATNVQDTPIAITAIGGEDLNKRGIKDPRQLSGLAPNVMVDQGLSEGDIHVTIRGQTNTSFALEGTSPAAIYLDDVFQPFQFGIGSQIFDLNRIEILRGPQGTLFGKNTTAGSVNYYSEAPVMRDEGYFTLDAGGGQYGKYSVEGAFNKVISSNLAVRASFRVEHRDSYIKNLYDGGTLGQYWNKGGRIQILWTPASQTKITFKAYGDKNNGDGPTYIARGYYGGSPCDNLALADFFCGLGGTTPYPLPPDSMHAYSEVPTREDYDVYGGTLKIEQGFGDYALTSISNYQEGHYQLLTNDDGFAGDFFHSHQGSRTQQMSEELRLATPAKAPLRAVLGLFGQYTKIRTQEGSLSSGSPQPDQYTQLTRSEIHNTTLAAFGSATYDISKILSITGGLRYTSDQVNAVDLEQANQFNSVFDQNGNLIAFDPIRIITNQYFDYSYALSQYNPATDTIPPAFRGTKTYHKLTWDATVNLKPAEHVLLYAKAGTGFRAGGFFNEPISSGLPLFVALRPEDVTNYEVGFKTEWWDRKLRINGDVYYTDYSDMQVQTNNTAGPGLIFSNAGTAHVKGVEVEVELAPLKGLNISGSLGYNDAHYVQFNTVDSSGNPVSYAGHPLPYAAKWTSNLHLGYEWAVSAHRKASINTDWRYRSRFYFDPTKSLLLSDPPRLNGDIRATYGDATGKWELAAYVNNLTNTQPIGFTYSLGYISPTIYAPKLTFGGQVTFRF